MGTGRGFECGRLWRLLGDEVGKLYEIFEVDVGGWDVRRGFFLKRRARFVGGGGESIRESGRGKEGLGCEVMVECRVRSGLECA